MDTINKKELSETDICDLCITSAIKDAGWDHMRQIRREVTLTPGPVIVRGNMSARNKKKKKFADYVLSWEPGVPFSGYNGNFNPEAYDVAKVNVELMKYLRWSWARSLTWEVAQ